MVNCIPKRTYPPFLSVKLITGSIVLIVHTDMFPETAQQSIALFDIFCGFPTIRVVSGKYAHKFLFSPTYHRQRNTQPTGQFSVAALAEFDTHTETRYSWCSQA